jgi:hypothetical protein
MAERCLASSTMKEWKDYSWALSQLTRGGEGGIFDDDIKHLFRDEMAKLKAR